MERERQALDPGQKISAESGQEHLEIVREYANFLLNVPMSGQIEITWDQVER